MLTHPIMLEAMSQAITEERAREAELMRASLTDHARRGSAVRSWLARTLMEAAFRLDSTVRDRAVKGTVPAAGD